MAGIVRTISGLVGLSSSPSVKRKPEDAHEGQRSKRMRTTYREDDYKDARYGRSDEVSMSDQESDHGRGRTAGPSRPVKTPKSRKPRVQDTPQSLRKPNPVLEDEIVDFGSDFDDSELGLPLGITSRQTEAPPKVTKHIPRPRKSHPMPDRWEDLSAAQQWKKNPNRRARQLKKAKAIRDDVKEPEYALRDAEIRDGLFKLMDQMQRLGKAFFAGDVDHPDAESEDVLPATFYRQFTRETAKIIGCVASGGPSGQYGWHSLFLDGQKRRTLVCAIIGNVLTEQVFQHMFFGGTADQIQAILQLQVKHRNQDGFIRNKLYAAAIRAALPEPKRIPPNFNNHVNAIVASLWTHLSPILHLTDRTATLTAIFPALQTLVTHAGLLSLHMRLDPHTVYYHEPTFKEDTFSAARMDCSNYRQMQQQHPRSSIDEVTNDERARRDALSTAETNRAKGDKPLTQIIILDCITAYRLGGWEAPTSNIVSPVYEWPEFKNLGVRARVLFPACVFCRWGRERAFGSLSSFGTRASQAKGDEAEAEKVKNEQGRRVHGTAWREGGFIEFTDVDGVFDWLGEERRERKALSDAAVAKAKAEAAAGTQERAGAGGAVAGEKEEDDEALLEALGLLPAPTGKGKTRDKANDKGKGKAKAVGSPGVQSIDVPEDTTPDWM